MNESASLFDQMLAEFKVTAKRKSMRLDRKGIVLAPLAVCVAIILSSNMDSLCGREMSPGGEGGLSHNEASHLQ